MIDVDEIFAVLDELEPWPLEWPQGEEAALAAYSRVGRARTAIAATYGMSALQTMRAERNRELRRSLK